jgi:two-component system NtrC family sensor kinase
MAAASEAVWDVVPDVLARLVGALEATAAALWLSSPQGLVRASAVPSAKPEGTTAADVATLLLGQPAGAGRHAERGTLAAEQLVSAGHRIGVISVRLGASPLDDAGRSLLRAVADVLAPALSHAERSHQLEGEVALRTRQIDEQRRFIEKVVDSLPVGLYVIDREYRIQAWNRKRETGMQGVSREEAIGRTIFEILHRQPAEMLRREFEEVFATGRIQQFEMESTATGESRTFRISKIPMRLDGSAITHVITIGEDVTDWKEAQERFAQAEKLAAIGQLAAGVMHEINNPLATIAACAESMGVKLDDAKGAPSRASDFTEYLKIIDNEVHRCKRIVDGLLNFSRPKAATREPVDFNRVVGQTLFLLKHHARFKHATVHTSLDPDVAALGAPTSERSEVVLGNGEQLVQVLMALLLNALDAVDGAGNPRDNGVGRRGSITVRTRRGRSRAEAVVAEVIDDGSGIARGDQSKIFEPFYTTKPPGRGTGLGLSICYGIVADHGGRIEVESAPGKGSTFRIVLPAAECGAAYSNAGLDAGSGSAS